MKKAVIRTLILASACALAMISLTSVAVADSLSFVGQSPVTLTSNGSGSIGFGFGPASVSGAEPFDDSLNNFTSGDNPFIIGPGIVLNGTTFSPSSTSVQIGDHEYDKTGLFSGTIDFITISSGQDPGSFTINISLSQISYSCTGSPSEGGCQGSSVLSNLAFGGQGYLSFSFAFGSGLNGPQDMEDLARFANAPGGGTYSSNGFNGTIDTNAPQINTFSETNVTAVPEPASLALLGSGLLGCTSLARRKFRR